MNEPKKKHLWGAFVLNVSIIVLIVILTIFIGFFIRTKKLIESEIVARARSHFYNIIVTRKWNAEHGGVYVELKKPADMGQGQLSSGGMPNEPELVLINPSLMIREMSEYAEKAELLSFHMTSLDPVNPDNKPDGFEKDSLMLFKKGKAENFIKEKREERIYFRYMAPLMTTASCLQCHVEQKYKPGDIRGGISITFDISGVEKEMAVHTYIIFSLGILTAFILIGVIYLFTANLLKRVSEYQGQIERMAITDELTGLFNRRHFFEKLNEEFERAKRYKKHISCIMIDIDDFKIVNDTYGHQVGDEALKIISGLVKLNCRNIDTVARYGGEELVAVLPETSVTEAKSVAEKIRRIIEERKMTTKTGNTIQFTISLGVAGFSPEDIISGKDMALLIQNADNALYAAKQRGKNRVERYFQ